MHNVDLGLEVLLGRSSTGTVEYPHASRNAAISEKVRDRIFKGSALKVSPKRFWKGLHDACIAKISRTMNGRRCETTRFACDFTN